MTVSVDELASKLGGMASLVDKGMNIAYRMPDKQEANALLRHGITTDEGQSAFLLLSPSWSLAFLTCLL